MQHLLFMFAMILLTTLACQMPIYGPDPPTPPAGFLRVDTIVQKEDVVLYAPSLSQDGRYLAVLGGVKPEESLASIYIVDLNTQDVLFTSREGLWDTLAISPDGALIAASQKSVPSTIQIIDWRLGRSLYQVEGYNKPAWSPDSRQLAFVYYTEKTPDQERRVQIRISDLGEGTERIALDITSPYGAIGGIDWSPAGNALVFVADEEFGSVTERDVIASDLYLLDLPTLELQQLTENKLVLSPVFSSNGDKVLYIVIPPDIQAPDQLEVMDLDNGACHSLQSPLSGMNGIALSADGDRLAFWSSSDLLIAASEATFGSAFWSEGSSCNPRN